jgi:hypothetical protein
MKNPIFSLVQGKPIGYYQTWSKIDAMKRIYQRRVTKVEMPPRKGGNGNLQEFFRWQSAPWQQELVQNTVNSEIEEQL